MISGVSEAQTAGCAIAPQQLLTRVKEQIMCGQLEQAPLPPAEIVLEGAEPQPPERT